MREEEKKRGMKEKERDEGVRGEAEKEVERKGRGEGRGGRKMGGDGRRVANGPGCLCV